MKRVKLLDPYWDFEHPPTTDGAPRPTTEPRSRRRVVSSSEEIRRKIASGLQRDAELRERARLFAGVAA